MVVYVGMDNKCSSVKHTRAFGLESSNVPMSCECGLLGKNSSNSLPPSVTRNTQRKFQINTDLTQPKNIGLHINTRVHLKPKKLLDYRDFINAALFCLLLGHMIFTYFQSEELRAKLEIAKNHLETLADTLDSISVLFEQFEERVKELEGISREDLKHKDRGHAVNKREAEPLISYNNTRQARSVSRGKHSHCKNRNGCRCRCYRTSGPFAVHLRGALPEITVRDGGIIAPWYIDKTSSGLFYLADGIVGEGRGIVEIVEEGLYFIYAQMYYLTSSSLNSYAINLQLGEERGREDMVVAVCSAEAAANKLSELSCFTAVVRYLHRGDRIYVTQRERNRRIIFRDNKSFLGLTLLNAPHGFTQ